jgi:simple sugar transport system ATP-binding protein
MSEEETTGQSGDETPGPGFGEEAGSDGFTSEYAGDYATTGAGSGAEALRVEGISKRFGPVTALRDINLHVRAGEVLGLLGDNGAGKSTLIKIITGFHRPDSGTIIVAGEETQLRSVGHARSLGIETVYQDLALVDELPVYLNFFLSKELTLGPFLRHREMRRRASEALDEVGINIPSVSAEVRALSGGQRQAIAVARAVNTAAKVLLLDEPLAAMGATRGRPDPPPDRPAQAARRPGDHPDRAQLQPGHGRVRPGEPPAARGDHLRPSLGRHLGRRTAGTGPRRVPRGVTPRE